MDPSNILFNTLIVGLKNSGKIQFLVNQLCGAFCGKFNHIVLICPTFVYSKTYYKFAEKDLRFSVVICEQNQVENCLYEDTKTLFIRDDYST